MTTEQVGCAYGTVGIIGLTIGGILGGIAASRGGLKKWLWPMVCAITLPDLVYVYLSYVLPQSLFVINVCVFIEQFGYGFGFTAYMLYLIYFSEGAHKTAHYAICTGFMALGMMHHNPFPSLVDLPDGTAVRCRFRWEGFTIQAQFWLQAPCSSFWLIAFACATAHNAAADHLYRQQRISKSVHRAELVRQLSQKVAMAVGQGVLVMLAGNMQVFYRNNISYSWSLVFYIVAGLFLLLFLYHLYQQPEETPSSRQPIRFQDVWEEAKNGWKSFM